MMYLCLRNHTGPKEKFLNYPLHYAVICSYTKGRFRQSGLFFKHKTEDSCHFQLVVSNPYRCLMSLPVQLGGAEVDRTEYRLIFSHVYKIKSFTLKN